MKVTRQMAKCTLEVCVGLKESTHTASEGLVGVCVATKWSWACSKRSFQYDWTRLHQQSKHSCSKTDQT